MGAKHKYGLNRAQLFPKKAAKADLELFIMRKLIEKAFPNRQERLGYIKSMIQAMDEPSIEIGETK